METQKHLEDEAWMFWKLASIARKRPRFPRMPNEHLTDEFEVMRNLVDWPALKNRCDGILSELNPAAVTAYEPFLDNFTFSDEFVPEGERFTAALRGPTHIFKSANPSYMRLIGKRAIIGRPLAEALPEIQGQGFVELLDSVYGTGQPHVGNGVTVLLQRKVDGPLEERLVNFAYLPIRRASGDISGVLIDGSDVTRDRDSAVRRSTR